MSKDIDKSFTSVFEEFKIYISKRRKKQGFETLSRNFKLHILPYFQDKTLNSITKDDIINWQDKILERNFSNGFNSSLYYAFSSFMNYCILKSYIDENVVLQVDKFPKKPEEHHSDYYTLFELRKFRKHVDGYEYKQYFNFIFFNGTRPSETMALKFSDLKGPYVYIHKNIERRGKRELDTPKNQSSIRYIKLSILTRLRIFKLKCYYTKKYGSFSEDYFIFGGKKPLSTTTIDRRKEKACKKANMREITQHEFRHSYTTRMIHKRKPIDEVSKDLGHSRVSTTVDVYLHPKKRVPRSTPFLKLNYFETLSRNFKNLIQSIITLFM